MASPGNSTRPHGVDRRGIVLPEANPGLPLREEFERMAKKRGFQNPSPFIEGGWWWINPRVDEYVEGRYTRKRKRMKVGPAHLTESEARRAGAEMLQNVNAGVVAITSSTPFARFIEEIYRPLVLSARSSTTRACYDIMLRKYLVPEFGRMPLRDMKALELQKFFSRPSDLSGEMLLKIRQVLSSVLGWAVKYEYLSASPMKAVLIPKSKAVNKAPKPNISPEEFTRLVAALEEPYATMVHVGAYTGLRVSELLALRWEDVQLDSLVIDERYCRGDWSVPKTSASAGTVGVDPSVIARIERLKAMEVEIRWGGHGARKRMRLVKASGPRDLVFQSIRTGAPMRDQNIVRRFLRPAAVRLGIDPRKATWRALRTSCATWMIEAGANPKDVQGQLRHTRISTTMDIYAQFVPTSQRAAIARMAAMVAARQAQAAQTNA